jgi:hypothetical protein
MPDLVPAKKLAEDLKKDEQELTAIAAAIAQAKQAHAATKTLVASLEKSKDEFGKAAE